MSSQTIWRLGFATSMAVASLVYLNRPIDAQLAVPEMVDPDLSVTTVVTGLTTPIGFAFLPNRLERRARTRRRPASVRHARV